MRNQRTYEFDNRDAARVYDYMEARIEALKRRIVQLEAENEKLRDETYAHSSSLHCTDRHNRVTPTPHF
jgi:cell division protein FtsB